ncbi:MAG: hypothetical protein J7545_01970 [Roseofilum sp. SBFL]|uniref:hypothetical protein n=1 Tax=Roseofilum sp. SBFL TaxID=2821496 RepID=UPI001B093001|nr:hypothetical protein [Roseofilum sp. SBFL]MBP0040730.1 hypothetical protein [Roseofilum sp. SBFL]
MATKQECSPLQVLTQHLQKNLNSKLPHGPAFRVQCLLQNGSLMVLAQHTAKIQPDTQRIFAQLQQDIGKYRPSIGRQGRIFVRVAGQKRPYFSQSFNLENQSLPEATPSQSLTPAQPPSRLFTWGWGIAGLLGLTIAGGVMYMMTRPCAIATCIPLETAQRLGQVAIQTSETTDNPQRLVQAQQQLQEAISQVERIPFWSPYFAQAQEFMRRNTMHTDNLDRIVNAFSQASEAAQLSVNPPHPLETWKEVEQLWLEAVKNLQQVSMAETIYPLVNTKLKEYEQNLEAIQNRLQVEQQAQQNLERAKQAADLAKTRQGIAQSLENWQQAYGSWNTAINGLKNIPQGTQAKVEANQLLDVYETQFQASRERLLKEEIASDTYNQALTLADKAKEFEQSNELALAVGHWSQAVNYLQQVPSDSFYYSKASPLVNVYQGSLLSAEQKLQQANRLEQARNDLNQTCAGLPKICEYTVSQNLLKVTLTSDYVKTVRQTLIQARGRGDLTTFTSVDEHVQSVQNALENISRTAGIALELYDAEGKLMGTYIP